MVQSLWGIHVLGALDFSQVLIKRVELVLLFYAKLSHPTSLDPPHFPLPPSLGCKLNMECVVFGELHLSSVFASQIRVLRWVAHYQPICGTLQTFVGTEAT